MELQDTVQDRLKFRLQLRRRSMCCRSRANGKYEWFLGRRQPSTRNHLECKGGRRVDCGDLGKEEILCLIE